MISNAHKNNMGTISFDGKFGKMRKPEDFIVYPMSAESDSTRARIQSDKRSGYVDLTSGAVLILDGGYFVGPVKYRDQLSAEELLMFKAAIAGTASGAAGKKENGIVTCDNSGALDVLTLGGGNE